MTSIQDKVTLAIAPTARGFGYVIFENPNLIMDYGVKDVRKNKLRDCLLKARVLIHMTSPSVLIVEDVHEASSRRAKRVRVLIEKLAELAEERGMTIIRCPRSAVLKLFAEAGAHNKDDIAAAVAKSIPELASRLPPRRRIWESEHYSMGMFEAAALALTIFHNSKARRLAA